MGTGHPRGHSPALEGTDWPASRGGLVTMLQGNGDQKQGREDAGAGK